MSLTIVIPFKETSGTTDPAFLLSPGGLGGALVVGAGRPPPSDMLSPDRVFVFEDAKSAQKLLFALGLEVARPVCLSTLFRILEREAPERPHVCASLTDAELRASVVHDELHELLDALESNNLRRVARLECLVTRPFASMEFHGLHIEQVRWQALIDEAALLKKEAQRKVCEHFSIELPTETALFSDNSALAEDAALNHLLDSSQRMKPLIERVLGKSVKDTRRETLESIGHPAIKELLDYREQAKLLSTYGKRFLEHVHTTTGRIHASFDALGTSSGRVSCASPNLQNLPSDGRFHACVAAPHGRMLVTADYSACELRVLAGLSEDPALLAAFEKDSDVHAEVATTMFGVAVSKTENAHLRKKAKAINFGLMYGMGARGLARTLECSNTEAETLFAAYFKAYPKVARYLEHLVDNALTNGYATTVLGRRLRFDEDVLTAKNARGQIERIAKNMPIQGTAAEIMKLAMVRLQERLSSDFSGAFFVNMIHDEIVLECESKDAEALARVVKTEMEEAMVQLLPLVRPKAEVNAGPEWKHD